MRNTKYTSQLTQGTGIINETLALLSVYQEGMDSKSLFECAKERDLLSFKTDRRLQNLVKEAFYPRFVKRNPRLPIWLHQMRQRGMSLNDISQLFMLYCARENAIFFDGITKVLNPIKESGNTLLPADTMLEFVKQANKQGLVRWSETIQKRNASYVRSAMLDFGLIDRRGNILPYEATDFTVLYIMYEAHLAGMSDMAIWDMEDWQLFNMSRYDVLDRIMAMSMRGGYVAQTSGDLLTISWNYKSMEELINAIV